MTATNLGTAPAGGSAGPILLENTLPQGVTALDAVGSSGSPNTATAAAACDVKTPSRVTCVYDESLAPYDQIEIRIGVALESGGEWEGAENRFAVSGGGAPPVALERALLPASTADSLGIEQFELRPEQDGGAAAAQAGSHPFQVTTAVSLTQTSAAMPTALPKDLRLRLPPGLVADASAVPACAISRFHEDSCPLESVVGVGVFAVNEPAQFGIANFAAPIFNLEPARGEPARFGAMPLGLPVTIDSTLRSDDYAVELSIGNILQAVGFLGATVTLWGAPADPRHDDSRGTECLIAARGVAGHSCLHLEDPDPRALLTLPTRCESTLRSVAEIASWADRLHPAFASAQFPAMTGCNQLPFQPLATATLTGSSASSPSGLDLELGARGEGLQDPGALAESAVKRIEVDLPQGFTLNPSAANGLEACGRAAYEMENLGERGCPDASRIGEVTVESPVADQPLSGSIYLGSEAGEQFDGSLELYLVARNAQHGLLIRFRALMRLDPLTGRATVVADDLPQLPLSRLRLSFPQGPRAFLAAPPSCGTYATEVAFTPYAEPGETVDLDTAKVISAGPNGHPCPGAFLPFQPALSAGTTSNAAGSFSPLFVRISRGDGEAELGGVDLALPPGLAAGIAGIPTCSSAALAARSCPDASRIGRTAIGAGVGPLPSYVPGTLYLAGPYEGAPFSLAAVIQARLGPLDLGTIVRRLPVNVDPRTGGLSVGFAGSQPLPSILEGVALHLRDLRLYFDRERFALNPSSCSPMAMGGFAYATDGTSAPLAERFQAADCAGLRFNPSLALSLSGALGRNGHPALRATIRAGGRHARIATAGFTLPPGQLLDFHHVGRLCPRGVAAERCPAASRIGRVRLRTPLLDKPLRGPIYLRTPARGLPDLVADLRSGAIKVVLHGRTATPAGRLRISLAHLPDLPLSEGVVDLDGGRRGLLVNSDALCGSQRRARAVLRAHSGKVRRMRPQLRLAGNCQR